ncbi:MAG TPA: M28 family peptidase [Saprospiraceae bacterium]|nr:M28 family peptidase [Saprospiraceae bacterium]HMQ82186.1 M28 family peptidase [Saprospiraceae bacterium]
MKQLLLFILLLSTYTSVWAQYRESRTNTPTVDQLAATITSEELERHLIILASDEFEGRETGQKGQKLAAQYIAEFFQSCEMPAIGDDENYLQSIAFSADNWQKIRLLANGEEMRHLWDFYSFPSANSNRSERTYRELTFLGYGIDDPKYSDYGQEDLSGKAIIILDGEPMNQKGESLLTDSTAKSEWSYDWRMKMQTAKAKGVELVIVIDGNFKENVADARKQIISTNLELGAGEMPEENFANHLFITTKLAKDLMGNAYEDVVKARKKIEKKGKSKALSFPCQLALTQEKYSRRILGENVLGYVEGTDAQLKEELLIVTAHYDHLGKQGGAIYHGADDNASGTATVLEIAEAFVEAKKAGMGPRRSVLFLLVSGEEKGLLGSEYYVNNPVFPLENTIANVNVDMVGRTDEKHADNPNYIYVIGSNRLSTELHDINERANTQYTQLELDYTYNAEDDPNRYYYRSDHYNFAERGIPAIFYFSGTHEDYHRPTDTADKIMLEKVKRIGDLVFYTCWELANRDERIKVDVK